MIALNQADYCTSLTAGPCAVRPYPFPYRAMLAICSDLDETPDACTYLDIMRFLNTTQVTSMGPGVGLEVGNTIYFDMPRNQFAYHTTDDFGRTIVRQMISSGHIDCLHSYGDHAASRDDAARALQELSRLSRKLEVWIDHAVAPSNFGADIMHGEGDVPGARAYHADLTCDYGVQYVWRGRVTSVIGQDVPRRLGGLFDPRHMLGSTRTIAKEASKGFLAQRGSRKYAMHADNRLMRRSRLRDGRNIFEFIRCNPYWGGVENAATADGVADALTPRMLDTLVARRGACILYTHLGKVRNPREPFGPRTREAFRALAERAQRGEILVTTTRRLLGYRRAISEIQATVRSDGLPIIDLQRPAAPCGGLPQISRDDLAGLTLYTNEPGRTRVRVDGVEIGDVVVNPADESGRASVSIPWKWLEFPDV